MLIKYDPVIPADPRLVISHRYEVRGGSISPLFWDLTILCLGCWCQEDNHFPCTPGVDFSDFRLWA